MQRLTGTPLTDAEAELPIGSDGYPLWIPEVLKVELPAVGHMTPQQRDKVRVLTTLLTSLRGIMLPPVLSTDTITLPYNGKLDSVPKEELEYVLEKMMGVKRGCGSDTS